MKTLRYAIIIEGGEPGSNFSAYVPDLPGCISTGHTLEELRKNMQEAISLHLHGLHADGEPVPEAASQVDYIEISDDPAAWAEGVVEVVHPQRAGRRPS